jgi:tRNA G18 (ribose-2'-O)-methylase SpoU
MGSLFARPPARATLAELAGHRLALSAHAQRTLREASFDSPLVLCLGAERAGLPPELQHDAVRIPVAAESLNVAMAATVALYEAAHRMPLHG